MVDISNQHWNEDGSITVILNSIEEVEEFVKAYTPATPDSKPPYQMEEYEKWDVYCFGTCNPQLTEEQNARNNHEAHWQEILAQEAIDKQIKNEK